MLTKRATLTFLGEALNTPNLPDFIKDQSLFVSAEILKNTIGQIKTASKLATLDRNGDGSSDFDLEAEINKFPDSLYVKCFAIKADEMNDNGDYFSKSELLKAYPTFVGVPVYTNHENNDINKARGKVVHSWWDEDQNGIMIIARVDAAAYPGLARGIKQEIVCKTSMGCSVKHSICSICHNASEAQDQFCGHIRERKTRFIQAKKVKCEYHKNGPEAQCPICGCKKGEEKFHDVNHKAFEYNIGVKFIENSFVSSPACHDCGITEIIDPQKFLNKVSEIEKILPGILEKAASERKINQKQADLINNTVDFLKNGITRLEKTSGKQELDKLNQAFTMVNEVAQSMLQQSKQIDMEFLEDLIKAMKLFQETIDGLTTAGYGNLASSTGKEGETPTSPSATGATPTTQPPPPPTEALNPGAGGGSRITSGPTPTGVGTVVGPMANKKIDFHKLSIINSNKKLLKNFRKN